MKKIIVIFALVCALFALAVSCENNYVQDMLTGPATLDSLAVQANSQTYDLKPYFSSEVYNYTTTVPFMTEEIAISGLAHKDGTARYSAGDGAVFGAEGGPRTFPFPQDMDEIYIRVRVSRPYMEEQKYTLHVVRGADSLLGNIEVHSGLNLDLTAINSRRALSPGFDPERFEYFARVLPNARALRIAGLINPAKVHIYFKKDGADYPAAPEPSFKEYPFPEAEEMTVIRIKVVPYEGSVEDSSLALEYMVTVSRNNIVYLDSDTLTDYPAVGETFGITGGLSKTGGKAFGPGEPVVFDLPAPFGYLTENAVISYVPEGRNPVILPVSPNGKYLFIMPDVNVRIKAVFTEIPAAAYTNVKYVYERGRAGADGHNWAHATRDLQSLIDGFNADNTPGTDDDYEIWIAKGTIHPIWAWARLDPSDPHYPDQGDPWYPLPDPQYRPAWAAGVQPAQRTMDNWCIVLKNGIKIYGGFAGTEETEDDKNSRDIQANETRLSGEMAENGKTRHLLVAVKITEPTVVDGITVTDSIAGGRADPLQINGEYLGTGNNANSIWFGAGLHNIKSTRNLLYSRVKVSACWTMYGGGVFNYAASPTFENCNITANSVDSIGGGVYNAVNSSPLFKDCAIEGNQAKTSGGGIYSLTASAPVLINTRVVNNAAHGIYGTSASLYMEGGEVSGSTNTGIYHTSAVNVVLTNVRVRGNRTTSTGGGIYFAGSAATSVLALTNVEITGNRSTSATGGGGMYLATNGQILLNNVTIAYNYSAGNSATNGGGGGIFFGFNVKNTASAFNNLIIWNNRSLSPGTAAGANGAGHSIGGLVANLPPFNYSLVEDRDLSSTGANTNGYDGTDPANNAPIFRDTHNIPTAINTPYTGGDYRLDDPLSPGIDAGNNTAYDTVYNALECANEIILVTDPGHADLGKGTAPAAGALSTTPGTAPGPAKDWYGADRIQNVTIDMGASEF